MLEVHANYSQHLPVKGYQHFWYDGSNMFPAMQRVDSVTMDQAFLSATVAGMPLPSPAHWGPVPVSYAHESYLVDDTVVILSRQKNPEQRPGMPRCILSLLAQTPERVKKTADKLSLPLEMIVEKSA